MAHRLLMRVVITGTQVFGRAFTEAYKQASTVSLQQSAAAATNKRTGGLTLDEACKILGLEKNNINKEAVNKKYQYLFDINSKEKSGSFYLQSKVYRAKERLDHELAEHMQKTSPPPASSS